MEEILRKLDKIFKDTDEVGKELDRDFEFFKAKLDSIVYGKKELCPPTPQQKKKAKRLSIIVDGDEIDNSQKEIISSQTNEITIKTEIIESTATSSRPSRAAKTKVGSFKEPALTGKLRRPSQADDTLSTTRQILEKTASNASAEEILHKPKETKANDPAVENDKKDSVPAKRSFEEDPANDNNNKDSSIESSKKVDESLLIVPATDLQIVELSDNETDKLMPPPADIPKKKPGRKGKQSEAKSDVSTRSSRLKIKQEKLSIDQASLEKEKVAQTSEMAVETIKEEDIKPEKDESDTTSKRGRGRRPKQPYKCMPIKEEPTKDDNENEEVKSTTRESRQRATKDKLKPSSMTSVYEDAVSENASKSVEKASTNPLPNGDVARETTGPSNEMPADATFVSAKDVPISETDATFVTSACPQKTFVMEKNTNSDSTSAPSACAEVNQTQIFSKNKVLSPVDTTFSINNETFKTQPSAPKSTENENLLRSSIMTEEDSSEEIMPKSTKSVVSQVGPKANQKKELFNPCIQSPVKKKVEAFEKHATAMASPAALRQTRTNARLKENKDPESKHITPLLKRDIPKLLTPTQQSNITPNIGIQNNKFLANSTSKLAQIQKSAKPTGAISKTQSLSRQNSVEDIKKTTYTSKLQLQVEEKKKKREQKQQQAQMTRDALVKEKMERTKKLAQEREMRRKVQEQEMKKQLESINKNIKNQEERLNAQKKLERKQQEQELAEVARKEREMLENMRIQKDKEELQAKLLENQRLQLEKKMAKKGKDALKYDFDLLNSSDSTDEEDKPISRKPPPPAWSKSSLRNMLIERQIQISTKVVDAFFSVQPMTADLREIFPAIDPKNLKRNSSMYWNTPPRYSQLPKY